MEWKDNEHHSILYGVGIIHDWATSDWISNLLETLVVKLIYTQFDVVFCFEYEVFL